MNQLTLDLAATSFFGADIGPEVEDINRAFVDMVAVAITPTPPPLPGRQMARVVNGRKRIVAYFREQIPLHRAKRAARRARDASGLAEQDARRGYGAQAVGRRTDEV